MVPDAAEAVIEGNGLDAVHAYFSKWLEQSKHKVKQFRKMEN